jgi:hypothetical protein
MVVRVAAFVEGPTEWYVLDQLYKRNILNDGVLVGSDDRGNISNWIKQPSNLGGTFKNPPADHVLLLYDQEQSNSPDDVAKEIQNQIQQGTGIVPDFRQHNQFTNVFIGTLSSSVKVVLHVANAPGPNGNRDFDGYIVALVENLRAQAVRSWLSAEAPAYLRQHRQQNNVSDEQIHDIGCTQIPDLMQGQNWPILRSKSLLYAYITALQAGKSHVWFAEKLVRDAPVETLQSIFVTLIAAWQEAIQ